jgi:hypothetical protein
VRVRPRGSRKLTTLIQPRGAEDATSIRHPVHLQARADLSVRPTRQIQNVNGKVRVPPVVHPRERDLPAIRSPSSVTGASHQQTKSSQVHRRQPKILSPPDRERLPVGRPERILPHADPSCVSVTAIRIALDHADGWT